MTKQTKTLKNNINECLLVIDFGSQVTQLIARRLRELSVYSKIYPFQNINQKLLKELSPKAIIFSGGPRSVLDRNSPKVSKIIYKLGIPILGICYGQQLLMFQLGGKINSKEKKSEFGRAFIEQKRKSKFLDGWFEKDLEEVWMSHGDHVSEMAPDFKVLATSKNAPFAMVADEKRNFYGVQFHPEVHHTPKGKVLFDNFLKISGFKRDWTMQSFYEDEIKKIRKKIGNNKVICALSGGVDSSVTAILLHKAIGNNLTCIFVNHGLLRKNEHSEVLKMFRDNFKIPLIYANESKLFLEKLKGITSPEKKRKIIGNLFIKVFQKHAKKMDNIKFLAQGTLYPDVIESVSVNDGPSVTIKSHHNVGGLPKRMGLKLIEPLRNLFKDEVRKLGNELNLPKTFINRHPFPGPGLAIRCPGEVTIKKVKILQNIDEIFIDQIKKYNLYDEIWQAFSVLLPTRSVGVMGDKRTYDYACVLRAVTSVDGMTADYFKFDQSFLSDTSTRIINEVNGVNRVTYDITSKPPGTIEWE